MTTESSTRVRAATYIAAGVAGLALVVLVGGWLLGISFLRSFTMSSPMAPLTAVLTALLSVGYIWFERRRIVANVAVIASSILAAAVLAQYLFGIQVGMQELTDFLHRSGAPFAELPAPDTAAAVIMLGIAFACLQTANTSLHDFADVVAVVIVIVCLQVLLGYAYSIEQGVAEGGFRRIAPPSTVSMILLSAASLARRQTHGVFASVIGSAQSALLLRRLLPITVLLCIGVGWLHIHAIRAGVGRSEPELLAWTITGAVVVLSLMLYVTSGQMRKAEAVDRARQEELLAAKSAAEAASEAKSRFMAVMSHELRTPLTAMIGYADLIDAGVAGDLSKEMRAYMHRIRASGWHLVGLIDAVLFYAGGKLPADQGVSARVDLVQLLGEVIGMFESPARDKKIAIQLQTTEARAIAELDASKLRQILINLIGNAVKFTDRGSVTVHLRASAQHFSIDVIDTGIGIAPEHLEHVWEPFQLADASHTRLNGGMGIGLALTRRIAEQLGARLSVVSQVGSGATFTVELPYAVHTPASGPKLQGRRVMVVDDESTVRRIMARTLSRYGAQVVEADSAAQALDTLGGDKSVDVLITDISMPVMNGIQLARQLRAQNFERPILFVTGAELDSSEDEAVRALRGRVLKKPFDMSELARTVHQLI